MSVRIEVWGNYACFSRPELKTERVSDMYPEFWTHEKLN